LNQNRKKYNKEFKQKAVELSYATGNTKKIADELGIDKGLFYRWRKELKKYEGNSFPGHGTMNH
jgi:transposase